MRQIHTASARAIDHGQASAAGVGRNAGQLPGFSRLDLRLTKVFDTARPFKNPNDKPGKLSLNVDLLNAFNRTNYGEIVGVRSSQLFGQPIAAEQARKIQLALLYSF